MKNQVSTSFQRKNKHPDTVIVPVSRFKEVLANLPEDAHEIRDLWASVAKHCNFMDASIWESPIEVKTDYHKHLSIDENVVLHFCFLALERVLWDTVKVIENRRGVWDKMNAEMKSEEEELTEEELAQERQEVEHKREIVQMLI